MQGKRSWLEESSKKLIERPGMAYAFIAIAATMPVLSTIAAVLLAFITLRKGMQEGARAFLAATLGHGLAVFLLADVSLNTALGLAMLSFAPVYLTALALRKFASWSVVAGAMLIQAALASLTVNLWMPGFLTALYGSLAPRLAEMPQLTVMFSKSSSYSHPELSHLLFSGQLLAQAFSTGLSLLFARYLQARCYNPGGLKSELQAFRAGRPALAVFAALLLADYLHLLAAVDLLPMVLFYFVLAGLNFVVALPQKFKLGVMILLVSMLLFGSFIMLFAMLVIIAGLDSLFNFRSYLPDRAVS